ncbi:hypothetical protein SSPO_039700 [Streptomyces antimycoticus]|uniref:Uncharacterized protein n=1 Tax=Streptomyces antimycoticus TaxID=68175 RepID=A0A499UKB6_9ACTN|nr:hypothetical protein SSPO_039700 [Streptomyces antimycoticus]
MEMQMGGRPTAAGPVLRLVGGEDTGEGRRRSESLRISDTRRLHTASGANRPVMTAPPVTTVSDI